jgi:hypothetical protein
MQSQPTSVIFLAEVRHVELQNEAAQERLAMQALTNRLPPTSIMAGAGRCLGTALAGLGTLLHDGLTSLRVRQRTTFSMSSRVPAEFLRGEVSTETTAPSG